MTSQSNRGNRVLSLICNYSRNLMLEEEIGRHRRRALNKNKKPQFPSLFRPSSVVGESRPSLCLFPSIKQTCDHTSGKDNSMDAFYLHFSSTNGRPCISPLPLLVPPAAAPQKVTFCAGRKYFCGWIVSLLSYWVNE